MEATAGIELEGVRVHNLKNVSLNIQRNALTVICGVSGCGKSSLAFDTLFAEGQRRYVETFSPYARQFLDRIERPDADRIDGIPPAIAIRQNARGQSSRSTIGTRTEILGYLRTIFAKLGDMVCADCDAPVTVSTADTAVDRLLKVSSGRRAMLVFSADESMTAAEFLPRGFTRGIVDGSLVPLESITDTAVADLLIVADRIRIDAHARSRIAESIELAFAVGHGRCEVLIETDGAPDAVRTIDGKAWTSLGLSTEPTCGSCGRRFAVPTTESLNFLSPLGACTTCEGHGQVSGMSFDKVVPDTTLSLREGAIQPWTTPAYRHELDELLELAVDYDIPCDIPFSKLSEQHRRQIYDGVPERKFGGLAGFHRWLVRHRYKKGVSVLLNRWRSWLPCPDCDGSRLNTEAASLRFGGVTITQAAAKELSDLQAWLATSLDGVSAELRNAVTAAVSQLMHRLGFMIDCGLGYLSLERNMRTLSGGEAQRVVLTAALGSGMINTLYVLDEPTGGLHSTDTQKVIAAVRRLRELGNTVVVVEHDADFIRAADEVIEIGPEAGESGGNVVFQGPVTKLEGSADSATGLLLARSQATAEKRHHDRRLPDAWLTFSGVKCHNVDLSTGKIPLGTICAVTGVSGSGKSSLIVDALYPAVRRMLGLPADSVAEAMVQSVDGWQQLGDVLLLDQNPLPRSRRSIPATIVGCFDDIRSVLADTHEAKIRNYKPGTFSFNSAKGGRCHNCGGHGVVTVEMQFLADIQTTCEACSGRRFRPEVLDVRYRDRNVHEILQMTADEAFTFFNGHRRIQQSLNALRQAGLGYIRLGQPVATLSGGESQRVRIAALLAGVPLDDSIPKSSNRRAVEVDRTLFILDEPSTGLHMKDIASLMKCLNHLVEVGHSVVVIEHDSEVVRHADYVIEMGPGPGRDGGLIISSE